MAETIKIHVKASSGGHRASVDVSLASTVGDMKRDVLAGEFDCPAERMRLIYKGRVLDDTKTLGSYGLQEDHTIHMVRSPVAPAAGTTPTPATTAPAGAGTGGGGGGGGGTGPFGGLDPGMFGAGMFGEDMLGENGMAGMEQMQRQMMQNPGMMRDMMNSPAMQNLMQSPETMRMLVQANPQLRELMDRHPELSHILNDPQALRQAMEIARNPELMREQMRSTDRAMANIEGHPEGFNMLRRMYENVQEPLMAAGTEGDANNPFASIFNQNVPRAPIPDAAAPNTEPLPNPWATTTAGAATTGGAAGIGGGHQNNNNNNNNNNTAGISQGLGGLGGLNFPMGGGAAGGMDPGMLSQMLDNPGVSQMLQGMLSNPAVMDNMINSNPQMREMMESNPQMRAMLQDPETLQRLSDPNNIRSMLNIQRDMAQLFGGGAPGGTTQGGGAGGGGQPPNLNALLGMFGGGVPLGQAMPAPAPVENPEEAFRQQLQQLQDMGFYDRDENIRALQAARGNVNGAVERLLSGGI